VNDAQLVVGYDRREASQHALDIAASLALKMDAHLHVVHVVDLSDYPVGPEEADWEDEAKVTLAEEREWASLQLGSWPGQWSYHLERGEPAATLCSVADRYDALMIVVGSGGTGAGATLHRLFEGGSVALRLVRGHRRPVLIVPLTGPKGRRA
jgi:nucleotide-binding universal stress UspA family protein